MRTIAKISIIIMVFQLSFSCEKDSLQNDYIIGTWVSLDKRDTLYFINDHTFVKSAHTYEYTLNPGTITIQYRGPFYILVSPSTHHFSLTANRMTIDFSNGAYLFNSEIVTYLKK